MHIVGCLNCKSTGNILNYKINLQLFSFFILQLYLVLLEKQLTMATTNQNKLIAEFMSYRYYKITPYSTVVYLQRRLDKGTDTERWSTICTEGNERFDKSWDLLKPVIDQITNLGEQDCFNKAVAVVAMSQVCISIEQIFERVIEFIDWYNENKYLSQF